MVLRPSFQTLTGAAVTFVTATLAITHSAPDAPQAWKPLAAREARAFYVAAAENEVTTRKKAEGRFRGSPWSRDDEFHNKEAKFFRSYGKSHRMAVASLVDATGRGMHEAWPTPPGAVPDQKVLPCRPRLTY